MQEEARIRNQNDVTGHAPCSILGYKFLKWGLGFFIVGLILGFGVLIHYLVGSSYDNSNYFLSNITAWFGSPLSLSVTYLQLGGLAMAIIGGTCLATCRSVYPTTTTTSTTPNTTYDEKSVCRSHHKHSALGFCIVGLIALFITGYIGYFVIDAIWPGFYYAPIFVAHNLWLILQGISILIFLIGVIIAFSYICCCCKRKNRV